MAHLRIALLFLAAAAMASAALTAAAGELPERLQDTGIDAAQTAFTPQYPLWSDGSAKRRWLYLPPGSAVDASRADEWQFPAGTKAWKEFSHRGRRIETRLIERLADGSWRFAAYVWNAEGAEARLAGAGGARLELAQAPGGRYTVPSRADCLACHEGAAVPILGFSAVQLAPELSRLAARGVLRDLSAALAGGAPRIAAADERSRAALGYLHGNCGHCHNDAGPLANLELALAQRAGAPRESAAKTLRSLAGHRGELLRRVRSTSAAVRMPPLGVSVADAESIALIEQWISHSIPPKEKTP